MRISFVSRSWLCHERSGVTFAVAAHVKILAAAGHKISLIGSNPAVLDERLPAVQLVYVPAKGSGAIYSPARVDRRRLRMALRDFSPQIVVVESWQTALTTAAVEVAHTMNLPILMISHGSSLHPFTANFADVLRSWAWYPYKRFVLPKLIAMVSVLTTLDGSATSQRFFDRELGHRLGKPVLQLVNAPANWVSHFRTRAQRRSQVLVVGYFSSIKNQLDALEVAAQLPAELSFKFVGGRHGRYYDRCVRRAVDLGIDNRVLFTEDTECDLPEEISSSLVVLSPSITEVLPLTLIEAMASGTPFVATPVGAVSLLRGGLHAQDVNGLTKAILALVDDPALWQLCSESGRVQYAERYTQAHVAEQLHAAIAACISLKNVGVKDFSAMATAAIAEPNFEKDNGR